MKPYAITMSVTAVVMAENEQHARIVAERDKREIFGDVYGDQIKYSPATEMTCEADLEKVGWDDLCIPYGGDGNTRLSDILAAVESEPERDTRTIDMFQEQAG
ncbi:hypothetical protein [Paraburkholderia dilworthii]|uniref:hypothetical protein n=1 Tax=Paraburkholderia dilworthii TaxID=948106 RepID=UPI0004093FE4|nr:hypothetical protein [Paraburkholderia dilworthii]